MRNADIFDGSNERIAVVCVYGNRDTVAMVTIIVFFSSSVLEIESPNYISYVQIKKLDATSDYDQILSMLMTVDT